MEKRKCAGTAYKIVFWQEKKKAAAQNDASNNNKNNSSSNSICMKANKQYIFPPQQTTIFRQL